MSRISRREVLKGGGALAAGAALASSFPRPAISQSRVLTVSTWGGITQDSIRAHIEPEFQRLTGATLAFDIGGQGARLNKLLAQRHDPPADVFYSTDEGAVTGYREGVLTPARRSNLPNIENIHDWAHSVTRGTDDEFVAGAPFTLISYLLGYNPEAVSEPVTSWGDMWRPEVAERLAFAAPVHTAMPALVILASELAGGSAVDVDPGFSKLAELQPSKLTVFWTDWASLNQSGDVVVGTEFDYYLEAMKDQGFPIDYVIPEEGGIAIPEYVTIVAGTQNQEIAEAFLNLTMDPAVQEAIAVESYQGPTNRLVELSEEAAARCSCGPRVEKMRFFDPEASAANRAVWTERLNTEVVPNWRAR